MNASRTEISSGKNDNQFFNLDTESTEELGPAETRKTFFYDALFCHRKGFQMNNKMNDSWRSIIRRVSEYGIHTIGVHRDRNSRLISQFCSTVTGLVL